MREDTQYMLVKLANEAGSKGLVIENNTEIWRGFKPFIGLNFKGPIQVVTQGKSVKIGGFKPDSASKASKWLALPDKGAWRLLPNSNQIGFMYLGIGFAPKSMPAAGLALVTHDPRSQAMRIQITEELLDLGAMMVIGKDFSNPNAALHLDTDFSHPGTIKLEDGISFQAVCFEKPGIYALYKDIWAVDKVMA